MSSPAQINANRTNAQSSTGPTSGLGKSISSINAVKTGLTGRFLFIPEQEANQYEELMLSHQKLYQPVGPIETALVQSITDLVWRLDRIPGLEMSLYEMIVSEFHLRNPGAPIGDYIGLEMQARITHEKHFRNLQIQENRLVRRRERETAELLRLQQERKAKETEALDKAAQAYMVAKHRNEPFDLAKIGFEFSTGRFEAHLATLTTARKQQMLNEALKAEPESQKAAA